MKQHYTVAQSGICSPPAWLLLSYPSLFQILQVVLQIVGKNYRSYIFKTCCFHHKLMNLYSPGIFFLELDLNSDQKLNARDQIFSHKNRGGIWIYLFESIKKL